MKLFGPKSENDLFALARGEFSGSVREENAAKREVRGGDLFYKFQGPIGGSLQRALKKVHGGTSDESCDKKICRPMIKLKGSSNLLNFAVAHDNNSVCHSHGLGLVVGDVDHRAIELSVEL